MLKIVKILGTLLFIFVFCASISFIIYFRQNAISDLEKYNIEVNSASINTLFTKIIWDNNQATAQGINIKQVADLKSSPEFRSFASQIMFFFQDLPVIKANLYNVRGDKILTTTSSEVINYTEHLTKTNSLPLSMKINPFLMIDGMMLETLESNNAFNKAMGRGGYTQIISYALYKDILERTREGAVAQTFILIRSSNNKTTAPEAVLELFFDVSEEWNDLSNFRNITIIGTSVIFVLFYFTLYATNSRAQRMIEKQHEENTTLTEAKERAENENKEKSKFLANISHELRTPLNAIIGFSEIIKSEAMGPVEVPQYKDYINDIYNSGTHLLSLINDILDFSKAEAEKLKVDAIEMDLTKTITTSLRLVQPRADEAKVNLVEDIPKEHIIMVADPKRMKQALLNLLSNSVKFTPEGGSVTLSAWIDNTNNILNIQVKDTGIGIANRDISKAMSTFGQVDSKLSRKYEGTGLGLPLTKKLIELMGGQFNLESELGFGTTVSLTFPYPPAQKGKST